MKDQEGKSYEKEKQRGEWKQLANKSEKDKEREFSHMQKCKARKMYLKMQVLYAKWFTYKRHISF